MNLLRCWTSHRPTLYAPYARGWQTDEILVFYFIYKFFVNFVIKLSWTWGTTVAVKMPKIFLIKNRLHQQQQKLLENQKGNAHVSADPLVQPLVQNYLDHHGRLASPSPPLKLHHQHQSLFLPPPPPAAPVQQPSPEQQPPVPKAPLGKHFQHDLCIFSTWVHRIKI